MRAHSSRRRLALVAALPAMLAGLLALPGPQASAAPAPVATAIGSVVVTGAAAPSDSAAPSALVKVGTGFSVTVTFVDASSTPTPVSSNKATTLTLSANKGTLNKTTLVVPAGAPSATLTGVTLNTVANAVAVTATVTAGTKDAIGLTKSSAAFDVLSDLSDLSASTDRFLSLTVGKPSTTTPAACTVTADNPYCADLFLPKDTTGGSLLSFGSCDGVGCGSNKVLQVLFGFTTPASATDPVTVVYRCDKTKCGNGGVTQFPLLVNLAPTGVLTQAPQCTTRGVVTSELGYCFDAKQSTRDNAGDLYLYLLLTQDARVSWP